MTSAQIPPPRRRVLGVAMSACSLEEAVEFTVGRALAGRPMRLTSLAVHGLVLAARDPELRRRLESFDILAADGQPVRWLMNRASGPPIPARVSGSDLLPAVCERAVRDDVGIYLYGSTPATVSALRRRLEQQHPGLRIVGHEPSMFRDLTPAEERELQARVNGSGAGILFLGLGCPLQEQFAYRHRDLFRPVQVCVGAAFEICAGLRPRAPRWMQRSGLEWSYRLAQEPGRLWKRYALTNAWFLWLLAAGVIKRRWAANRST